VFTGDVGGFWRQPKFVVPEEIRTVDTRFPNLQYLPKAREIIREVPSFARKILAGHGSVLLGAARSAAFGVRKLACALAAV
jgi:hypothetical protein